MAATAMMRRPSIEEGGLHIIKSSNDLVIAGYASVDMVDKQGDKITAPALKNAFGEFMKASNYRNVQLAHSNIQVGEVIPHYTDSEGRVWKSGVDDSGMFVVIKLRDDIEKAREVANQIRKGSLRGFSIGGQAFKRINKHDAEHGSYTEISKLELHEVTICEKGINPEATFRILKEDKTMNGNENDALGELSSVLDRLNKKLDDLESGAPAVEEVAKEFPPKMNDKEEDSNDESDDNGDEEMDDEKDEKMAKGEYSDVITSDYLNWMESTLKSQGVDIDGARTHFDDIEKHNLGSTPKDYPVEQNTGQTKDRTQEGGNPSTGAVPKLNSGKVKKSDFIAPDNVTPADIEAAYEVYKAAAVEEQFKSSLNNVFSDRLSKEQLHEKNARDAAAFDARGPLGEIQKAIEGLSSRIDEIAKSSEESTPVMKSANNVSTVSIPSAEELGNMSWDDVHALAGSVWQ
tara:strand:- start:3954 stop:5333 length:1380 start_codon:yes stop_codon:yes gene_type:complete